MRDVEVLAEADVAVFHLAKNVLKECQVIEDFLIDEHASNLRQVDVVFR